MDFSFGTYILLILSVVVDGTQYCSSVTLGKVTSISCGDHYHCCEGSTRCCLDSGYLPNGVIVGIAVGGAVLIALIVCLTICYVKSRNKQSVPSQAAVPETGGNEHVGYNQAVIKEEEGSNRPPPYSADGEIPPDYTK